MDIRAGRSGEIVAPCSVGHYCYLRLCFIFAWNEFLYAFMLGKDVSDGHNSGIFSWICSTITAESEACGRTI